MTFQSAQRPRRAASIVRFSRRPWPVLAVLLVIASLLGLTGVGLAQPDRQEPQSTFAPASFPQGTASSTTTDCLWVGENYGEPNAEG